MDSELAGRVVVVTGASSGVGLACVAELLAEGATVVAVARREHVLREAMAGLAGSAQVTCLPADVTDPDAVATVVDETVRIHSRLDAVVNNAGASRMARLGELDREAWVEEWLLKISPVVSLLDSARRHLASSPVGSVVNINATLSREPDPSLIATGAARAGLLNLTKSLARELAPDGIRINSVLLGLIESGQWERRYQAASESGTTATPEEWRAEIAARRGIPLSRFGKPREVAAPVVALLSPRWSYVTGSVVTVDGGLSRAI